MPHIHFQLAVHFVTFSNTVTMVNNKGRWPMRKTAAQAQLEIYPRQPGLKESCEYGGLTLLLITR